MALLIVEENAGPGVDYTDFPTAIANASPGDTIRTQQPWSAPIGPFSVNQANLTIEAVGSAANVGVIDEIGGTYCRIRNTLNQDAIRCFSDSVTIRGFAVKLDHGFSNRVGIRGRAVLNVDNCIVYGPQFSTASGQHGVTVTQGLSDSYVLNVSNSLFFRLRGAAVDTEWRPGDPVAVGIAAIRGCSFYFNNYGVRRVGAVDENEIYYFLHSDNFGFCNGPPSEATSVYFTERNLSTLTTHKTYVNNCISDDNRTVNGAYNENDNCLQLEPVSDNPNAFGQLVSNYTSYPYNFNPIAADFGDNVLVDHHAEMTDFPGGLIFNPLLAVALNDVLRETNAVDCGAFELLSEATGNIDQDLPFIDQAASASAGVYTADIDTIAPFIEQTAIAEGEIDATIDSTAPFVDENATGQVIIQVTGAADYVLPWLEITASGTVDQDVIGDIDTSAPFIEQAVSAVGLRIATIDTDAPFIDTVAGSQTIAAGDIDQDLPFIENTSFGAVETVTTIDTDAPFIEQTIFGDLTIQGAIDQDLPFIEQLAEQLEIMSTATINSDAPFIEQVGISILGNVGNIDMTLPFMDADPEPGVIIQVLPWIQQTLDGTSPVVGDIDQDLPFVEQQASGGEVPPAVGEIEKQTLPWVQSCAQGRAPRLSDIVQDLPFMDIAGVGTLPVVGTGVQGLPFIEIVGTGPGPMDDDLRIRVCTRLIFSRSIIRTLRFDPRGRRLRIEIFRRRGRFICANYDPTTQTTTEVEWVLLGSGEEATGFDGLPFDLHVKDQ